ncbi:MAG: hypothetical protein ABI373_08590 [Flavobacteriales bacterium]
MNGELSKKGAGDPGAWGLRKRLDEAIVLLETVQQLRKDLREEDLHIPKTGPDAFEELRAQVLITIEERERQGAHAFGLVVNRVDLTEHQMRSAMAAGGMHGLAGAIVLRCLQKVLSRKRFAGLG